MIKRLLIANRGEIACRIIETARKLSIVTIALYSEPDQDARHTQLADEAYALGGHTAQESYLDQTKIITIAKQYHIDAIHPGYGFLSENPSFSKACEKNNIIFIGPSANVIDLMGSKKAAKNYINEIEIPTVPGFNIDPKLIHSNQYQQQCERIGFPILIKAAAGGGGKGMRIVHSAETLNAELEAAQREAQASFDDGTLIVEKYLENPRHIECQVFADKQGNVVHLFERDCSIQRRYQKIIEEAPAPNLLTETQKKLHDYSVQITQKIEYVGAGTIEYLVDGDNVYFMEMNTRLQVEHPVTEMVTGLDLVEWQLKIASDELLPCSQKEIQCHGHAIEVRLYAEDPYDQFKPKLGKIEQLILPETDETTRVDHALTHALTLTPYYDPMIAKVITYGETRADSLMKMKTALSACVINPIITNQTFLNSILEHEQFMAGVYSTHFINTYFSETNYPLTILSQAAAALYFYLKQSSPLAYFQLNQSKQAHLKFETAYTEHVCYISEQQDSYVLTGLDEAALTIKKVTLTTDQLCFEEKGQQHFFYFVCQGDQVVFYKNCVPIHFSLQSEQCQADNTLSPEQQTVATMPGTIAAILVEKNALVQSGAGIVVIEAMKMQHTLTTATSGKVSEIYFKVGDTISEGDCLYDLEAEDE